MNAELKSHGKSAAGSSMPVGPLHATMDFETRNRIDISVGAYKYALTAEVLCLAYKLPGGEVKVWNPSLPHYPDDLLNWIEAGGIVEGHNVEFEYAIWNYCCVPKYEWPRLEIPQLLCSAAKAAALALPRALEDVGAALSLPIQKDMEGHKLMMKMSKPRKPTKNDKSEWFGAPADFERLYQYCKTDVVVEELTSAALMPLIPSELELFHLTMKINERGIYCDVELCKTAVRFAGIYSEKLTKRLIELTNGIIETAGQNAKLQSFLSGLGVNLENMQAPTVELALSGELPPLARHILEIRQALNKSSISKFQAMIDAVCPDGRIKGTLLFCGCSTGRYSGRGIQPQNYAKPKIKDVKNIIEALKTEDYEWFESLFPNVFLALSAALRGMLIATPGNDLVSGDYNAIEARGVQWVSGDEEGLESFRSGADPYKEMASEIFGKPVSEITAHERFIGKETVLGSGFQMGPPKFQATLKTKWNVEITEALAKKAIYAYREKHEPVKKFWYANEDAAVTAVKNPGKLYRLRSLQYLYKNHFLQIQLPSGRRISYFEPRVKVENTKYGPKEVLGFLSVDSKTHQWRRETTYGGKLTENCFGPHTLVFTSNGLKKIIQVRPKDKVFDGNNWVPHSGLINQGKKSVIQWHGIQVTPDQLIHDGSSWFAAIHAGANTKLEGQKWARSLGLFWLQKQEREKTLILNAYVLAEFALILNPANFFGTKLRIALNAVIEDLAKKGSVFLKSLQRLNFLPFGFIDIPGSFHDAITPNAPHIKITADAGSGSIHYGKKTPNDSFFISKLWTDGINPVWSLTEKIIRRVISPVIFVWFHEKPTLETEGQRASLNSKERKSLLWNFGKSIVLTGKAKTLLFIIWNAVKPRNKSPNSTNLKTEVYDLMNCGPNNRFMVLTDRGPVIVHNCVQAIARDIMTHAMKKLEERGYPIILTVHDELVCEIPQGWGSKEEFLSIMADLPPWAKGFPVKVEGWREERYKK